MINALKQLKQRAVDGQSQALLVDPKTLFDILDELENMIVTSDQIEAIPVNNNRPGFWLKPAKTHLFYVVSNGELDAGWIPFLPNPAAPGL